MCIIIILLVTKYIQFVSYFTTQNHLKGCLPQTRACKATNWCSLITLPCTLREELLYVACTSRKPPQLQKLLWPLHLLQHIVLMQMYIILLSYSIMSLMHFRAGQCFVQLNGFQFCRIGFEILTV